MKKTNVFGKLDFAALIEQHNPFGIKGSAGNPLFFDDYEEVYSYVLKVVKDMFPRGYIDLVLLINILTHLNTNECYNVFRGMRGLWGDQAERLIKINWQNAQDYNELREGLKILMRSLHVISETPFNDVMFEQAFQKHFGCKL